MSGSFSVPFVRKNFRQVSGYVPIAATGMQQVPVDEWSKMVEKMDIM
jgi:hypothetical protein